ncbi:ABC transporter ATP-binding protein [Acetobacter sp. TBRC 12305]|uniref:ABC transporter ATP-binding protein n=1 Tax=Acetobacter garciniae TaxID=2817435 RepID=A0A939HP74_9PROT|nr:ABC transporter ATP-binding protein [Acetobacter garciniae]MBO1325514.1 ABC transporter ATP-binding protein [Acetobacter garciniae]MBX0345314.1 ABC transporter ATP-binding protein [Acetobacter garciniae]
MTENGQTDVPCVELRQVEQRFTTRKGGNVHALGPLDLTLRRGEFLSIVGPSGCGKSTLLDILSGLARPAAGQALLNGQPIRGVPDGVGIVFQEDASFGWLTVENNIAFGLKRRGLARDDIAARVEHALDFMGLRRFRTSYPSQLSGGMRQRVCIARTLVMRPSLILLDEPFGALDQQTRLLMGDELLRLWRETNATILLITHSLDEAVMLSDRIGVMSARPGRLIKLVETGWPRERDSTVVSSPHYGDLLSEIWAPLRAESNHHMAANNA